MSDLPAARAFERPGRNGYRWPAEWEPHAATWLSWPHNQDTWPSGLARVEDAFCEIVRAVVPGERVRINVDDASMEARVRGRLEGAGIPRDAPIDCVHAPTDDAWVRDHGGLFVVDAMPRTQGDGSAAKRPDRLLLDFAFDAWGGKYPPWDRDARIAGAMAEAVGVDRIGCDYVLEAGAIDGDGEGTLLTTESCLLNPNRSRSGQDRSRGGMERLLAEMLGARRVLWLGDGIAGDDTDGHVDDLTRFVAPGRVVTAVEADPSDENRAPLEANRRRLAAFRDVAGRLLDVVELPMPGRIAAAAGRLPASYANFYVANAAVLVPVFGVDADREALSILEGCFPDRGVVPIPSRDLVEGLGAVHCLTQQEPAPPHSGFEPISPTRGA